MPPTSTGSDLAHTRPSENRRKALTAAKLSLKCRNVFRRRPFDGRVLQALKRSSGFVAIVLLLLPCHFAQRTDVPPPLPLAASPLKVLEGRIAKNATLETALRDVLSRDAIYRLVQTARPVYDLARLSVGRPFVLTLRPDGLLSSFSYGIDDLRTVMVERRGEELQAQLVTRSYEARMETARGVIHSSLFGAVSAAGEQDQLALDLASIFEWDVDFNTELQRGDSFRVAVQKLYLDGRFSGYGGIVSAELVRGERTLQAVRFEGPHGIEYFHPDGRPVKKPFLRSPLKFSRISSGFSRSRFHPILKKSRPHLGIDFAAPTGTAVRAAANGVVVGAGWSGGYGNLVRIRHPRGLESLYGHLSRIAVKRGQRVVQGDLIGAVGSTGLSTAPHLDYRIVQRGEFVNPLKMTPPPPEPLPQAMMSAFRAVCESGLTLLDGPAPVQLAQSE
jgi:murein DD-endopeptidase MepM/ murein hydrolase activator NlpD